MNNPLTIADIRKMKKMLESVDIMKPYKCGKWFIVEDEKGWYISNERGDAYHPKTFCQMVLDEWNS